MFVTGQKVVCVNAEFDKVALRLYKSVPIMGGTYTVRAVYVARGKAVDPKRESEGEIGVLLKELVNPPDPFHSGGGELGFRADRFAEEQAVTTHEELVEAGHGSN